MTEKNHKFEWAESVTLKEHIEALLVGLELRIEQARISMEKRLDAMNEFREALRSQSANSPSRNEMTSLAESLRGEMFAEIEALKKDMKSINSFRDSMGGKASQKDVTNAQLLGIVGVLFGLVSLILRLLGL